MGLNSVRACLHFDYTDFDFVTGESHHICITQKYCQLECRCGTFGSNVSYHSKNRIMVFHTFVVIFCEEQDHEQGGNWPWVTLLGGLKND